MSDLTTGQTPPAGEAMQTMWSSYITHALPSASCRTKTGLHQFRQTCKAALEEAKYQGKVHASMHAFCVHALAFFFSVHVWGPAGQAPS